MAAPRSARFVLTSLSAVLLSVLGCVAATVPAQASPSAPPAQKATTTPVYLDTRYSFAERAADLVSRMTLSEKVQQLHTNNAPAIPRLGVQQYTYWSEGQHGLNRLGADAGEGGQGAVDDVKATSFPVNFASTMSWDPSLTYQETTAISDEARGYLDKSLFTTGQNNLGPSASDYGDLTFWAPTVNMDRDPRWGRTDEAFGEDPYLVGQMAGAFVNGYQGNTMSGQPMSKYLKVASTAKHYALNNVESNRNSGSSNTTDANIRDYYTKQFQSLTENAHVSGLMTSYNAVNGTPSPADTYTVNELLQRTYGFNGYTTSDCGAVGNVYSAHQWSPPSWGSTWTNPDTGKSVPAPAGGQAFALRAGTDLNCTGAEATLPNIQAAIDAGALSEGVLDNALVHLFTLRMQTGEFDPPAQDPYTKITKSVIQSPAHQALAAKVAANDLVLLKNDNVAGSSASLLPADPSKLNNVVIVGNLANTVTLGGYSGKPSLRVNAVQGITAAVKAANPNATVTFDSCGTSTTTTTPASCSADTQAAIQTADLVIVFVGTDQNTASEGKDRTTLAMPGNYNSLISQVNALGNPRTALVIQSDGPVDISGTQGDFPAILFSGYNGESQGTALAQVLLGQVNPAGHLDFTWFKDDSQLPDMQNYGLTPSQTGGLGRTYQYFTGTPTYPFGYGLSYAKFSYSHINIGSGTVDANTTVPVSFDITNTGTVPGATVAQLYVAPQFTVPGVQLPKEQLTGFQRTNVLAPGQSQHITLHVKLANLSRWDEKTLKQVVDNGAYEFQLGPDSATAAGSGTITVKGAIAPASPVRHRAAGPGRLQARRHAGPDGQEPVDRAGHELLAGAAARQRGQRRRGGQQRSVVRQPVQGQGQLRQQQPRRGQRQRHRHGQHAGTRCGNDRGDRERRDRQYADPGARPVHCAGAELREVRVHLHRDHGLYQHRCPGRARSADEPGRAQRLDGVGELARIVRQRRSRSAGDDRLERHDPRQREPGQPDRAGRNGGLHRRGRAVQRKRGQRRDHHLRCHSGTGHADRHPDEPAGGVAAGRPGQPVDQCHDGDRGQLDAGQQIRHPGAQHHHRAPVVCDRVR